MISYTINLSSIILLLVLHYIGEFVTNIDNIKYQQLIHSTIYSCLFFTFGWKFVGIIFILHTFIDMFLDIFCFPYIHNDYLFIITIGFQQFFQVAILFITYGWLTL